MMNHLINELKRLIKGFLFQEEMLKNKNNRFDSFIQGDYPEYCRQKNTTSWEQGLDSRLDKYLADCNASEQLNKAINDEVIPALDKALKEHEKQVNKL